MLPTAHGMIHTGITVVGLHPSVTTGEVHGTTDGEETIITGTDLIVVAHGLQLGDLLITVPVIMEDILQQS